MIFLCHLHFYHHHLVFWVHHVNVNVRCCDSFVQAKTEIAKEVKDTLTKSMASFGFMIIETLVRLNCLAATLLTHLAH